jgi:hypothetical protein
VFVFIVIIIAFVLLMLPSQDWSPHSNKSHTIISILSYTHEDQTTKDNDSVTCEYKTESVIIRI